MLTLADEAGLSGFLLASRVRRAFLSLPPEEATRLLADVREESARRHLVYLREGRREVIQLFPCPLTALPDQLSYLHFVTLTLQNVLKRLPELYFQDFEVREILRLTPAEEEWLWQCWGPGQRDNNPVFGRLDAVIDFTSPMWKSTLRFMEPNMSGIGGLYLQPASERLLMKVVVPRLQERDPELQLEMGPDMRQLLMQEIREHLEAIGRPARTVCFVEPKYSGSGIDEQEDVADYIRQQFGLRVLHADPSELELRGAEVFYAGEAIDVVYRDYTVADLIELGKTGVDVRPMRELFHQNRVISSITAELDQKSCWEVLTDARIAERHFNADERRLFRRHVLWTRLVAERSTTLPDGTQGDLMPWVRRERETLVLKPNRAYGGEGVTIGPAVSEPEWDAALDGALVDPNRWVVQQLAPIPVAEFPVISPDGQVRSEPFHVVMGFAPTQYGVALLGRASQKQVVNIAQRGGLFVVLVGRPSGGLQGPG